MTYYDAYRAWNIDVVEGHARCVRDGTLPPQFPLTICLTVSDPVFVIAQSVRYGYSCRRAWWKKLF